MERREKRGKVTGCKAEGLGRAKWWVVAKVIGRQSPSVARLRQGGSLVPVVKEAWGGSEQS